MRVPCRWWWRRTSWLPQWRQQCQRAQTGMTMRDAASRADDGLPRQFEAIAAAFALGLVDPARESTDAVLVTERCKFAPCQQHVGALRLLVLAHQQRVAARRRFPCDRAPRVAAAIGAQVVDVVTGRMQPRARFLAAAFG